MKNKSHAILVLALGAVLGARSGAAPVEGAALATAPVLAGAAGASTAYDGVVEAVRQTVLAAQVAGAVTDVMVRPGDAVRAGQVLVRLDARAAGEQASAVDAQAKAAAAALDVANRELERQRALYEKRYVSQGAFERAQAQQRAAQSQLDALGAQSAAAHTESGFFVLRSPYAGIVSQVPATVGDMALPGRALALVYDPVQLRVTAWLPSGLKAAAHDVQIEIPGAAGVPAGPLHAVVLPAADPATHTIELRAELPRGQAGVAPGMFARVRLLDSLIERGAAPQHLFVPQAAVVRRAELTGVYVVDAQGRPQLRLVRLGEPLADRVEVLTGVFAGERVALDPQAAARVR